MLRALLTALACLPALAPVSADAADAPAASGSASAASPAAAKPVTAVAPATPPVAEDSLVARFASLPKDSLQREASGPGWERGVALLFLSIADTARSAKPAQAVLDSSYRERPSPMRAALLGTSESLCARDVRGDVMEATKWVGKALKHLDEGVRTAPENDAIRIFRINSLYQVPEIFHVEERLEQDGKALKAKLAGDYRGADSNVLLALASVAWRMGRSREAVAHWKLVAARGTSDRASAEKARKLLAAYNQ